MGEIFISHEAEKKSNKMFMAKDCKLIFCFKNLLAFDDHARVQDVCFTQPFRCNENKYLSESFVQSNNTA